MKPCHTVGAAHLCEGWVINEENLVLSYKQTYCTECGRPVEFNFNTYRWRHIVNCKSKEKK